MKKTIHKNIDSGDAILTDKETHSLMDRVRGEVGYMLNNPKDEEAYWWNFGLDDISPIGVAIYAYKCSNCGYEIKAPGFQRVKLDKVCRGCGCKMRNPW